MDIPQEWSEHDRRNFVGIAQRRQFEHLLAYGVVAIGAQLFYTITSKQVDTIDTDRLNQPQTCKDQRDTLEVK